MIPVAQMPARVARQIQTIFTDIDDTLTTDGLLPACAFDAIWSAHDAGLQVVLVTGRPAGWCDHLARMWPVAAVVGENGALAYALQQDRMRRIFAPRDPQTDEKFQSITEEALAQVPGCKIAADQPFRQYDLAVDFAEEVDRLDDGAIDRIVAIFQQHGARAKVSSIHVNGWFGDFDKLSMCRRCSRELLGADLDPDASTFVGDSPNDVPMFRFFPHAVGVANVRQWTDRMEALPAYVTLAGGGQGFAELVQVLLRSRD